VYRPTSGIASGIASKVLKRTQSATSALELADALALALRETVRASLARYDPRCSCLSERRPCLFGALNLFSTLLMGRSARFPYLAPNQRVLPPLACVLRNRSARVSLTNGHALGRDACNQGRPHPHPCRHVRCSSGRAISVRSDSVLRIPDQGVGQALLQRNSTGCDAGDFAVSQAEELKDALDALTSNDS